MPKKLTAKQRSRMTPEELQKYENDVASAKRRKAISNQANYAKNRDSILAKRKREREEDPEAYNERQRNYNAEHRDRINENKRKNSWLFSKKERIESERKQEERKKELEELQLKYPYFAFTHRNEKQVIELGGKYEVNDGRTYFYGSKGKNLFKCEYYGYYYKYTGTEKMDKEKFFTTALKHECETHHHSNCL